MLARLLTRHTLAAVLVSIAAPSLFAAVVGWQIEWLTMWQGLAIGALVSSAVILVFTRVGLVGGFVVLVLMNGRGDALGTDLDSWLAPYGLSEVAIKVAIAVYGFWVSLAGQPIFKDMLAEPEAAAH